ncbi:unnamed protein product [Amaranthus hypochondriacus]
MEQPHYCRHPPHKHSHHLLFFHPTPLSPHHHHHHHHHHLHHQHHHHHHLHHHHYHHVQCQCAVPEQNYHSHYPNSISLPLHTNPNLGVSGSEVSHTLPDTQNFIDDGLEEYEELEDEDPIYVMTDEWREFFAKSEAKRREAKKQAKKQGKSLK